MILECYRINRLNKYRSSRPEVFCKKVLLENPRPATLLKKLTLAQVLSCEFFEISKNTFLHRTLLVAVSISKKRIRNKHEVFPMLIRSLIYQLTEAAVQECSTIKVLLQC